MPGPMLMRYPSTNFKSRIEYNIFAHTFSVQFYVFYICIHLWNYHHSQGSEHMHHLPEFSDALGNASLHLWGALFSWSIDNIAFSRTLHKWNHIKILCIFWLIPFTMYIFKRNVHCIISNNDDEDDQWLNLILYIPFQLVASTMLSQTLSLKAFFIRLCWRLIC